MEIPAQLDSPQLPQLQRALLEWYERNRRDLPWRKTRDPYRVWVSEIMLQQTRVAAVLPRYEQFLRRFPSVHRLASARVSSVLAEWSGLGYYRRARNLHAAAKVIVREYGGEFPRTAKIWRTLPGIGQYTAAAIASIGFEEPIAVLDSNVQRVMRRLLGCTLVVQKSWSTAQELLEKERPGDFNQAMMELGATICLPSKPACGECPIQKFCRTRGRGKPAARKLPQRKRQITYALVRRRESVLLLQRSVNDSLMPGMWELPEVRSPITPAEVVFTVRHSITVTDYTVTVVNQLDAMTLSGKWTRIHRLNKLPLTGLAKKVLSKAKIIQ